jgi:hypothetical protein
MKKIYLLLSIFGAIAIFGQAQTFVRIYNASAKKIGKGNIVDSSCTDSVMVLRSNNDIDTIAVEKISYIKTKHGIGNNILIGASIGAPVLAIVALASNTPCDGCIIEITDAEAAFSGFLTGAVVGAAIGAITGIAKNSKRIAINGDRQKWHNARIELRKH